VHLLGVDWSQVFTREILIGNLIWEVVFGLVVVRIWAWFKKWPMDIQREIVFWIFGFVVLFAAAVFVAHGWTQLSQQLSGTNGPKLKGVPSSVTFMPSPNKPSDTLIMIGMTIYNAGAPSVVRDWALAVTDSDKNEYHPTLVSTTQPAPDISPAPIAIPIPSIAHTTQGMKLGMQDYLVQKADQPIISGGQVDGWLAFDLQDVSFDYLKANAREFELTFSDVSGQTYSVPIFSSITGPTPTK